MLPTLPQTGLFNTVKMFVLTKINYGGIMRYVISFIFLTIFFFAFSCTVQKSDYKGNQEGQINMSKIKGSKCYRDSAPIGKESHNYVPGEILIKFKDGTDVQTIKTIQKKLGLITIKVVPKLNIYRMKIQNGSSVEEVMKRLQGFREVEYSEPNYILGFQQ